jgi:hypothetical protein
MDGQSEHLKFLMELKPTVQNLLHIPLFGLFAYLWLRAFTSHGFSKTKTFIFTIAITVGYGILDELHQTFVPGRYGSLTDMLLNIAGIITGAMDYYANIDGVKWFCEKIFPIVKDRYPKVQFYIVGSNPNPEIQKLGSNKCINVTGFVEDIRPYYNNADVCVIPLRIARGIQNKVLEAMSMGKAVVTTSTAVQSIKAISGVHLLLEDNFDKFAEAVSMLLENHTLRNYLGTNARQFVKSNYNWQGNMKKFDELMGQAEAGRL